MRLYRMLISSGFSFPFWIFFETFLLNFQPLFLSPSTVWMIRLYHCILGDWAKHLAFVVAASCACFFSLLFLRERVGISRIYKGQAALADSDHGFLRSCLFCLRWSLLFVRVTWWHLQLHPTSLASPLPSTHPHSFDLWLLITLDNDYQHRPQRPVTGIPSCAWPTTVFWELVRPGGWFFYSLSGVPLKTTG